VTLLPEMNVNDSIHEDDRQLLQLMLAGEERGFASLYKRHQASVYRFSLQISGRPHLAEDVTQETFLVLIRAPHRYQPERGPLLLYLFGIARKLAWKSMRKERFSALDDDHVQPVWLPDLAGDLERKREVTQLTGAILSLPRKYRDIAVLCALQELSYEEAASVVGCSVGTVRSRLHRAKDLLLRKLKERGLGQKAARNNSVWGAAYDV
jgi:RNA polymerase sigma-70 factor (ECF subfamily)